MRKFLHTTLLIYLLNVTDVSEFEVFAWNFNGLIGRENKRQLRVSKKVQRNKRGDLSIEIHTVKKYNQLKKTLLFSFIIDSFWFKKICQTPRLSHAAKVSNFKRSEIFIHFKST